METPGPFAPFSFDQILAGCADIYKTGVKLRYAMYANNILKSRRLDCPVISIGNLAVGGSGKTPMAIWLAKMLVENGWRPVVISRGYRGTLKNEVAVVSNGRDVFLNAKTCGDEPYMMAMEKAFPVVAGKDRYKAGLMAIENFAPDVVILDDGFQHLKLRRNVNLVLLDHRQPLGNGYMLPAGRLRETLCMAKDRIDAIVFTRCPSENASFAQSVQDLGVNIAGHLEFCDHYRYNEPDFKRILAQAKALNLDFILTTQKDWVKLNPAWFRDVTVVVMGVRLRFTHPQDFEKFILDNIVVQGAGSGLP